MKPVEGKIKQCLANNNIAPFSLVSASYSSNGPIKGNQPWSFLGMSQIDYLTMSKLCSQITDNRDGVCARGKFALTQTGLISDCFHTCLGFKCSCKRVDGQKWKQGGGSG